MKKYIFLAIIVALVFSFILGTYLYKLSNVDEQIAFETEYIRTRAENTIQNANDLLQETNSTENKTTPNTIITEKVYYNDCGHLVETEDRISDKLINKTEAEFQIEYIGWTIQKFTSNEVVVYKEINDFCDQHYLLKSIEGEVIVYRLDKNENEVEVIRETGIQTKYLPDVDVQNLEKGIKVYGSKELNQLLEDYE